MNRRERRAMRARKEPPDLPPGYAEQVEHMAKTINRWLDKHPGAAPVFRMPPREAMVIVELPVMIDRIAVNDDARAIAVLLVESYSWSKCPSLFMLRIALMHTPCKVEVAPLEVFTAGFDPLPIQRGGQA